MSETSDFTLISHREKTHIEGEINGKLKEMGRLRDFFGSGHGVDVVGLMSAWVEREIAPHEMRLGVKLTYLIETLPDGISRIIITGISATP